MMHRNCEVNAFVIGITRNRFLQDLKRFWTLTSAFMNARDTRRNARTFRSCCPRSLECPERSIFLIQNLTQSGFYLDDVGIVIKVLLRSCECALSVTYLFCEEPSFVRLGVLG